MFAYPGFFIFLLDSIEGLYCYAQSRASQFVRGACRMRAGQGICVLRQGILSHFRPLLGIFGENGLFKDTFLFEGRGCIPPPPLDARLL